MVVVVAAGLVVSWLSLDKMWRNYLYVRYLLVALSYEYSGEGGSGCTHQREEQEKK